MTFWDMFAIGAVILLGVPHGGLDGAVARRVGWPSGPIAWLGFHLGYITIGILVTLFWWSFPLVSLALFLAITAVHFGASDIADIGSDILPWVVHGGLVTIAIPNLQSTLVEPIFTILIGAHNASLLMNGLSSLFLPWLLGLIGYCIFAYNHPPYRKSLLQLLVFFGLAIILPPLISFALYFCLSHSRGHLVRLWRSLGLTEQRRSLIEATIYTLISWLSVGIIIYYFQTSFTENLIKLTFIGLAALTLPHMLLVDCADRRHNSRRDLL
jgi:Brp/Blh family beta-carotene 15,15'-monooxygenase